ncbi:MAG: tetratricopeptide repeat protein, partial [Methanomassiliicoccales archaeon]|nr:tetratricopeptide repeat protein [Methanomassiliicoccales archaeon]
MGFLDSLTDRELKALKKAQKTIEGPEFSITKDSLMRARDELQEGAPDPNAVAHRQEFSDVNARLSELWLRVGDHKEAAAAADRALMYMPNNTVAVIARARATASTGAVEDAICVIDWSLARTPSDKTLWMEKGWILDRAGRSMPAVECFKRVMEIDPNDPAVYDILAEKSNDKGTWMRRKGEALMAKERYEDAVKAFDQAAAVDPNDVQALIEKGKALMLLNKYDEAGLVYQKVLEIDPRNFIAHLNRARSLRESKDYQGSIQHYKEALRSNPADKHSWIEVASLLEMLERFDEALKAYDRSLEIDPDFI